MICSDTTAHKKSCQLMYQNPTYVISHFKNLANLNCKFHTTKILLKSTIISSHPSNMGLSKKPKTSTTTKTIVNKGHDGRTDVNVNGSIPAGACIIDTAAIGGANAAGNPMIEVDVANTTNVATSGKAIAATAATAWQCHRSHHGRRQQRNCRHSGRC